MNTSDRVYPEVGEKVRVIGCYSECLMAFDLAGRPIEISLEYQVSYQDNKPYSRTDWPLVGQCWKDGQKFSGPVLPSECGFYFDSEKEEFYCYPDDGPGDPDPKQVRRDLTKLIEDAIAASGVPVTVITNLGFGD